MLERLPTGSTVLVCAQHTQGAEQDIKLESEWTVLTCYLDRYVQSERGPRDACPWAGVQAEIPGQGKEQPHFPPVTAGMTKDANGLNQKNGRRQETRGQEKVCRCAPSTAL